MPTPFHTKEKAVIRMHCDIVISGVNFMLIQQTTTAIYPAIPPAVPFFVMTLKLLICKLARAGEWAWYPTLTFLVG